MKRVYKNRLSEFVFHDAWVSFISYDDNKRDLKLSLREFTIKDKIKGNVHIDRGIMLFEGLTISELCYPGCDSIYKDGKLISVNEPKLFATDKEYELITNLKGSVQILDVEEEENGYFFSFDIINGGFFNCTLSFESVSIEVDCKGTWQVYEIEDFGKLADADIKMRLLSAFEGEGYKILARKNIWTKAKDVKKKIAECFSDSNLRFKKIPDVSYSCFSGHLGDIKVSSDWYEIKGSDHLKKLFLLDSMTEVIVTADLTNFNNYLCQINFFDRDILGLAIETSGTLSPAILRLYEMAESIFKSNIYNYPVFYEDQIGSYGGTTTKNAQLYTEAQRRVEQFKCKYEVASDVSFKEVDDAKLDEIEEIYGFNFPISLRKFYSDGIPYAKNDPNRFPRWWDTSPENVEEIKQRMRKPLDMLERDIRENGFWIEEYWGKRPEGEALTDRILLLRLLSPPLIPIYCHRYMAVIDKDDSPVISAHGQDTIYYGKDFQGYLDCEFTGAPSESPDKEIPLWSGVIEYLNTSNEHFEFLRKRHFGNFGYYVSYNYIFTDVDKTLRILNALKVSEHKLLYGVNYYQNTGLTNDHLSEIEDAYQIYARDSMAFGDNENIKNIPRILGEVIKKDTDGEKTVKSQKEMREYIDSLGSKKAFKYKYLIALLLRTFDQRKRIRDPRSELLTHDKIRFCGEKDISFATHYEVCGKYDPRNLYIWFEIDMEDAKLLLCDSFFEAVITDDLENFENHLYTLSMVEYNNFNFVIGGNDLAMKGLVYDELAEICCDEEQFAKYTPERKNFM